jgi:hypothetical protein
VAELGRMNGWAGVVSVWAGRQAKAEGGGRRPKRKGGETGRERVAAQREGRREQASLEGKEVGRLLGWVEVAWASGAELGNE